MKRTKKRTVIGIAAALGVCLSLPMQAQYVTKVFDFLPAPGQFTNESIARRASATNLVGNTSATVSLGSFGGYVVVGFDQPVVNDPQNPYGVDFSIEGNSFAGNAYGQWCEPGAVQVMKDENGNGLPDDGTWYELAGSDYYLRTTQRNLTVTYYNPHYSAACAVPWQASDGTGGALVINRFHQHPYYPDPFDFGMAIKDSVSFTGNKIRGTINMSAPSYLNPHRAPAFGYCDSKGNNSPLTSPKNPYTAGTDGFDLAWAVDSDGKPVELDTVHFVRIYNAGFANIGWLGEWSTEVLKVAITKPDPDYVPQDFYRHYIGLTQLHVLKGHSCRYDGLLFKNGRPQTSGTPRWWTSDNAVATVDNEGNLTAHDLGSIWLYFSQKEDVPADSVPVEVVELRGVVLEMEGNSPVSSDSTALFVNEKIYIIGECEDSRSEELNGSTANRFIYEPLTWTSSRPEVGVVNNGLFTGLAAGRTVVYARSTSRPDLVDSMLVVVKPIPTVQPIRKLIRIPSFAAQGSYAPAELFTTGTKAEIVLHEATASNGTSGAAINKNTFTYQFTAGSYSVDTVHFRLTVFGGEHEFDLVFSYMPAVRSAGKQVVYAGVDNDKPSIKSCRPATAETKTLAAFPSEIVEDLLVDGAYLFVTTNQSLYRYNLSTCEREGERPIAFAPKKTLIAQNRLFVIGKEDGKGRLLAYYKSDLSPCAALTLPAEPVAMTALGDSLYIVLNNGDQSSLAIVTTGLNGIALAKTLDWGSDGRNVSDLLTKGDRLLAIRPKSATTTAAVLVFSPKDESRTLVETPGVEAAANTSAVVEPMAGDTLLLRNGRGLTVFNTATLTLGTSTVMRDPSLALAAAVYDPSERQFYVAYTGETDSRGAVFSENYAKVGDFDVTGSAPRPMRFCPALTENDRPEIKTALQEASVVERKTGATVVINKVNAFSDAENNFGVYPRSTPSFLTWSRSGENLRYTPSFDGYVTQDSTVTIEVEAIDHYGCATVSPFAFTIKPRLYAPRLSSPLIDQSVAVDAPQMEISLADAFEFLAANVAAKNVVTLHENTHPALVTARVDADAEQVLLSFAAGQTGTAVITLRGTTVETAPDSPDAPESKSVDASFTVTVGQGETVFASPSIAGQTQVYPTLTHGLVTLKTDAPQSVAVFNIAGRQVKAFAVRAGSNAIDLSDLPSGIYFVRTQSLTVKVIKLTS
jgi:hypothetical protein